MTTGREPSMGGDKRIDSSGAEPKLGGEAAILHLVEMLHHDDRKVRYRAALKLAESGDDRVFDTLVEMLQDKNGTPRLRGRAAMALGQLGDERAIEPLLASFDSAASYSIVSALILIGGDRAMEVVEELVYSRRDDSQVYRAIRENLPGVGGQRTIEFFTGVLQDITDPDPRARELAAHTLSQMGSQVIDPLLPLLNHESHYVRSWTAQTLGRIKDQRLVEPLSVLLADDYPRVVVDAMLALGRQGNPQVIHLLVDLTNHPQLSIARAAVFSLVLLGDTRAVEPLLSLLNRTGAVPKFAAEALGRIGGSVVVKALGDALVHERGPSRELAFALAEIGTEEAILALLAALQIESVWQEANTALSSMKDFQVNESAALPLLHHSNPRIRSTAAKLLSCSQDERVVEELIERLSEQDYLVRGTIISSLGKIGDRRAVEPLIAALQDGEKYERTSAARALGNLGDRLAVEPLIAALQDSEKFVRSNAAEALGNLGDRQAVEPLFPILADPGDYVRVSAVRALGELGDLRAVEPLIEALKDNDWVSGQAARVLGKLGDERAVEPLKAAMYQADQADNLRLDLVRDYRDALEQIGTPEALAAIEDLPFRDLGD